MEQEETPGKKACCGRGCPRGKLHSFNYLDDVPGAMAECNIVEVQFKNTRKGYYVNSLNLPVEKGDMVAVESSPGHDVGCVTLTGPLVLLQMKRAGLKRDTELKRLFRMAKPADIEKFEEARAREEETMIRARQIAEELGLKMKIGDVEYQGDGNKAIFYYIADERVDFRQLIKVLADAFKVRIEMKQDLSLNPQKLAGQCAKLKCCLNYEVDAYVEAVRKLPGKDIRLETADATWYFFKADIFKGDITYSSDKKIAANLTTIDAARAFEIAAMNKSGEKPAQLKRDEEVEAEAKENRKVDLLDQDNINRFDNKKKKKKKKKKPAVQKKDGQSSGSGGASSSSDSAE